MDDFEYKRDTALKYQDEEFARQYKRHLSDFRWYQFATAREIRCIEKALRKCGLSGRDRVLDVPCGTGILSDLLLRLNVPVVASDISREMMQLAHEYQGDNFYGFVQADATQLPFAAKSFKTVVIIGLLHRVPPAVRQQILNEAATISSQYAIVSFSLLGSKLIYHARSLLKKLLYKKFTPGFSPATLAELESEVQAAGFRIVKRFRVFPILSPENVALLEKT